MLQNEMDHYTRNMYKRLLPEVAKLAYHDMHLTSWDINEEDLQNITYQICEGPLKNNLDFWGYVSVVDQMEKNADWHDITNAIKNSITEYMEQKHLVRS